MSKEEIDSKTTLEENEALRLQLAITQDLLQLKDDAYFRQQLLASLERISLNLEKIGNEKK
jgi:hypothetical protein